MNVKKTALRFAQKLLKDGLHRVREMKRADRPEPPPRSPLRPFQGARAVNPNNHDDLHRIEGAYLVARRALCEVRGGLIAWRSTPETRELAQERDALVSRFAARSAGAWGKLCHWHVSVWGDRCTMEDHDRVREMFTEHGITESDHGAGRGTEGTICFDFGGFVPEDKREDFLASLEEVFPDQIRERKLYVTVSFAGFHTGHE